MQTMDDEKTRKQKEYARCLQTTRYSIICMA